MFDAKNLNSVSKYQTDNAFLYAEFTNVTCGIFGHASCPGETLHCHLSGIMQYQVECLVRMVGNVSRKKLSKTTELDELHTCLAMLSRRQSTRPLLSCSVFGGFSDNNKVGCGEIFGNWAILLLMTYTSLGENIMKMGIKNENVSYRKLQECIKLQLAWEKWTHKDQSMSEVDNALSAVTEYMLDLEKNAFLDQNIRVIN